MFLVADGWTALRAPRSPLRQAARLSTFVAATAVLYFAVQLGLSSVVPDFPRLLAALAGLIGVSAGTGAPAPGLFVLTALFALAYVVGTFFDYLVHRFVLHGWLFVLHENHHLPTTVSNLMPGIVARPFVAIPNLLINAG